MPKMKRRPRARAYNKIQDLVIRSWDDIKDEDVREKARELAGGDRKRVQVVGPTEVIIHNNPWKEPVK